MWIHFFSSTSAGDTEEIQNFLASYQVDAYKNVSIFINFFIRQAQFEI